MEIGQAGQSENIQALKDRAKELSNSKTTTRDNQVLSISPGEAAQLIEQAIADDGSITQDELQVINSALAQQSMSLSGVEVNSPTRFTFTIKQNDTLVNCKGTFLIRKQVIKRYLT